MRMGNEMAGRVLLAATVLLTLLSPTQCTVPAEEKPRTLDTMLVGPFTLANLCEMGGSIATDYAEEGGASEKEILRALATCDLFLLDKKEQKKDKLQFAEENGYPKVVAG